MAGRDSKKPQPPASTTGRRQDMGKLDDYLDEQEMESFPASDAHSDWAGPPSWMHETEVRGSREDGERMAPHPR